MNNQTDGTAPLTDFEHRWLHAPANRRKFVMAEDAQFWFEEGRRAGMLAGVEQANEDLKQLRDRRKLWL